MEKYNLLKNEYIYQNYPELNPANFWFWFCNIMPFILTYIYIWWAPKFVINPAFKKQALYANERRRYKLELENKLLSIKQDTIKRESQNTEQLIKLENKKKELQEVNPEHEFDAEFDNFIASGVNINALEALKNTIYKDSGYISHTTNPNYRMIWDVNGLTRQSAKNAGVVEITDKGKEFLKRLSSINKNML